MARHLKVLHVIGGISWKYGGTTATILPMCNALASKSNLEIEIATTDADGPNNTLTQEAIPTCAVPIHLFHRARSERWKYSPELYWWLQRHVHEYDLLHIHGIWGFCSLAAARAARRHQIPYIIFPQGMLSEYTFSRAKWTKRFYWRLIERKNILRCSHLHLTTQGEALEIERLGLNIPASCIPLGIDPEAWSSVIRSDWLRGQLGGRDRGRPIILFLSRLHPKKGIVDYLLPAFARVKSDAFLVIAGGEDSTACEYPVQIQATIRRLGLTDKVHLLGPVSKEDRWSAFDGADIFILPSQQENFGLVITEAMIRGCPVIVSDLALACEHVRAAGAGWIIPLSLDSFSKALDELVISPSIRATMGLKGRKYASTYLGWDRIADSIFEMYCKSIYD